jgi:hypothetical protein
MSGKWRLIYGDAYRLVPVIVATATGVIVDVGHLSVSYANIDTATVGEPNLVFTSVIVSSQFDSDDALIREDMLSDTARLPFRDVSVVIISVPGVIVAIIVIIDSTHAQWSARESYDGCKKCCSNDLLAIIFLHNFTLLMICIY